MTEWEWETGEKGKKEKKYIDIATVCSVPPMESGEGKKKSD